MAGSEGDTGQRGPLGLGGRGELDREDPWDWGERGTEHRIPGIGGKGDWTQDPWDWGGLETEDPCDLGTEDRWAERMTSLKKDLSCLLHTKSPEINHGNHAFQTYIQLIYLSNQFVNRRVLQAKA